MQAPPRPSNDDNLNGCAYSVLIHLLIAIPGAAILLLLIASGNKYLPFFHGNRALWQLPTLSIILGFILTIAGYLGTDIDTPIRPRLLRSGRYLLMLPFFTALFYYLLSLIGLRL